MSDQELQDHGSLGSAASTNNNLRALAQDVQRVFRIPHKVILDMLLANLGLNPAQYECAIHDDKLRVTVSFNTAALDLGGSIVDVSVPGEYCTDESAAEDSAAIKAVRYIETMTNTVVRDINYAKTKRQENRIVSLKNQLKASDIKSKEFAKVSGTFLFGGLLDKLDLPVPRYRSRTHHRGQFVTDVAFYPSKEHLRHPPTLVTLSSSPLHNLQSTIDVVSQKAIHYMEDHQKKVLQDYNYVELKRSEETNLHLTDLLAEKDGMIRELTTTFGDYTNTVFSVCDQITRLATSASHATVPTPSSVDNRTCSEIQSAVARLSKLSHEAVRVHRSALSYAQAGDDDDSAGRAFDL